MNLYCNLYFNHKLFYSFCLSSYVYFFSDYFFDFFLTIFYFENFKFYLFKIYYYEEDYESYKSYKFIYF